MNFAGRHTFGVRQEELFQRLLDPAVLHDSIPGCEELVQTGEAAYSIRLSAGFGPIRGTFNGTVVLKDLIPPRSYTLELKGEGRTGFVSGLTRIALEPLDGGAATEIRFESEVQVGGLIAGVGARFIPGAARNLSEQFFTSLEKAIEAQAGGAPGGKNP